jgi:hypothetical protein
VSKRGYELDAPKLFSRTSGVIFLVRDKLIVQEFLGLVFRKPAPSHDAHWLVAFVDQAGFFVQKRYDQKGRKFRNRVDTVVRGVAKEVEAVYRSLI